MPKTPTQRRIAREIKEALQSPRSKSKETLAGRASRKPPLNVQRGIEHLRVLTFGPQLTRNPDLPDKALADLEAAKDWLNEVVFGRGRERGIR